jgi:sensor histidine kinase YesM
MKQPESFPARQLTSKQHWRVALSLLVIYYPILLYLGFPNWDHTLAGFVRVLPFTAESCAIMLPLFYLWLRAAERVQQYLFRRFGEDSVLEMAWPAQLITFLVSVVLAVLLAVIHLQLLRSVNQGLMALGFPSQMYPDGNPEARNVLRRAINGFFVMLMLAVFYLLANRRASGQVQEYHQQAEQLKNEQVQAQLAALKSQVNPHFLFNSLSILTSLVDTDPKLSIRFIGQLARVYRYTLEQQDQQLVPLQTELEFIQAYIFLLHIRFRDKFTVEVQVPPAVAAQRRIAPLTLQLLLENVVKHNQMSAEQPLRVLLSAEDDELLVRNNVQRRPVPAAASTHVGLSNIRNRYRYLTDRPVVVEETSEDFTVRIPLL